MKIAAAAVTATPQADQETQSPRMVKLFALNRTPKRTILILHYQVIYNDTSNTYYVIISIYLLYIRQGSSLTLAKKK